MGNKRAYYIMVSLRSILGRGREMYIKCINDEFGKLLNSNSQANTLQEKVNIINEALNKAINESNSKTIGSEKIVEVYFHECKRKIEAIDAKIKHGVSVSTMYLEQIDRCLRLSLMNIDEYMKCPGHSNLYYKEGSVEKELYDLYTSIEAEIQTLYKRTIDVVLSNYPHKNQYIEQELNTFERRVGLLKKASKARQIVIRDLGNILATGLPTPINVDGDD